MIKRYGRWLLPLAASTAIAAVAVLIYGLPHLGYDPSYALLWGRDLIHGVAPDFSADLAPTPHPLENIAAGLLAVFGDNAAQIFTLLTTLSFGWLGWVAFRLGKTLVSTAVGIAFAVLLLTRPAFFAGLTWSSIDIVFVALCIQAAVVALNRDVRSWQPFALLAVAGLFRPEAWGLALIYLVLIWRGSTGDQRLKLGALALAAPVLWLGLDLLVTGNPFHSFTATRDLGAFLHREHGLGDAIHLLPNYLEASLGGKFALLGCLVGLVVCVQRGDTRLHIPLAIALLGVIGFLLLGVMQLPLLTRYLALPTAMFVLFAAVAVGAAFKSGAELTKLGRFQLAAGLIVIALLIISIPTTVKKVTSLRNFNELALHQQTDLQKILDSDAIRTALPACRDIYVPNFRPRPLTAYLVDRPVSAVISAGTEVPHNGILLTPNYASAQPNRLLDPFEPRLLAVAVPKGFAFIATNRSWQAFADCN